MIMIGIDPHKSSLTAVAVDDTGHELVARLIVVNAGTSTQLISWAQRWPQHRFAVKGAKGLGRGIAQRWPPPARTSTTSPQPSPPGRGCLPPAVAARPTQPTLGPDPV